ncbi:MAG: hypothetical protein R3F43_02580 [bacterium]
MRVIPWLLLASPALAQLPPGVELPVEGAIKGRSAVPVVIRAEVVEVRAGPGAAYVSRGRAYRGDAGTASRRNEAGDWVEVAVGGLRGWARVADLRFGGDDVRRGADGAVDAGRDRRETNYRYDERGRRLRADGTPMGSGEGTEGDAGDAGDARRRRRPVRATCAWRSPWARASSPATSRATSIPPRRWTSSRPRRPGSPPHSRSTGRPARSWVCGASSATAGWAASPSPPSPTPASRPPSIWPSRPSRSSWTPRPAPPPARCGSVATPAHDCCAMPTSRRRRSPSS